MTVSTSVPSVRLRTEAAATAGLTGCGNQYVDIGTVIPPNSAILLSEASTARLPAEAVFSCLRTGGVVRRRGAPQRKPGARHKSGRLKYMPAVDHGPTPELEAKRQRLVGDQERKQRYASYPLGVLYARRLVLSGEHYAGTRYARLFSAAVRPLTIPSILGNLVASGGLVMAMALVDEVAGTETDPTTGKTAPYGTADRAAYLAARKVLERRGLFVAQSVDSLVLYEIPPHTTKRLDAIRDGLDALHRHFEEVDARSRAATAA